MRSRITGFFRQFLKSYSLCDSVINDVQNMLYDMILFQVPTLMTIRYPDYTSNENRTLILECCISEDLIFFESSDIVSQFEKKEVRFNV